MSRIRNRDTKPEMKVRKLVHSMGYRYRLHKKGLPGRPDLVFPRFRKIIFVHGCFFHFHDCRYGRVVPKTNGEAWTAKREGNVRRDAKVSNELKELGWDTFVIWECETKDLAELRAKINNFLPSNNRPM